MLWIAFKSLYLWYSRQHGNHLMPRGWKLWIAFKSLYLWYSRQRWETRSYIFWVVNCFQKFISLIFETTENSRLKKVDCCELLSKVYIFDIRDNWVGVLPSLLLVVNCFQKFISLIFETTTLPLVTSKLRLWIAFKSLYLWYSRQPVKNFSESSQSCELLSKVYIFDIRDNYWGDT